MAKHQTIGASEIHSAIERLAEAISNRYRKSSSVRLLGIANGGVELTRRLTTALAKLDPRLAVKVGTVDISFHRDDIGRHPIPKEFAPTHIPFDVQGADIILVDDVLFSGRTLKAALDEIFDHGRPAKVELAILVDRGGRRLPFAADYTGITLAPKETEKVVVVLDPAKPELDTIQVQPAKKS